MSNISEENSRCQVTPVHSDEEVEEEAIKPVLSAKKSRKVESSDSEDSDSTLSYTVSPRKLRTPASSEKRSHHSDAESDDDFIDDKNLSESAKKKYRRIKEVKDSQEMTQEQQDQANPEYYDSAESDEDDERSGSDTSSSQSDTENDDRSGSDTSPSKSDTENDDRSGSDTSPSQSDTENDDSDFVEQASFRDRRDIQKLKRYREDGDGTRQMLRYYLLWVAMKANGNECEGEKFKETMAEKRKLEGRIEVAMNICQSQAWSADFTKDVRLYPEYVDWKTHEEIESGDIDMIEKCQVCNREDHPWSVIVSLEGLPYDKNTFQTEEEEEEEDSESTDFPPVSYFMGCFCHPRTKLYHNLYHFGYHMYRKCLTMLEDDKSVDDVARDKSLRNEAYDKLRKWMDEAEKDYTEDGKRANSKWKREYVGGY